MAQYLYPSQVRNLEENFDFFPLPSPHPVNHQKSLQHYLLYASHICLLLFKVLIFYSSFCEITFCWASLPHLLPIHPIFHIEASIILLRFKPDHVISPVKIFQVSSLLLYCKPHPLRHESLWRGEDYFGREWSEDSKKMITDSPRVSDQATCGRDIAV